MTFGIYWISSIIGMVVLGAVLCVVDKYMTIPVKRFFWGIGRRRGEKMPVEKEVGFIYGRLATGRFLFSVAWSAGKYILAVSVWMYNPVGALLIAVTDTVFMTVGTYFGGLLDRLLSGTKVVLRDIEERVEKPILRGETSLGEVSRDTITDIAGRAKDAFVDTITGGKHEPRELEKVGGVYVQKESTSVIPSLTKSPTPASTTTTPAASATPADAQQEAEAAQPPEPPKPKLDRFDRFVRHRRKE